MSVLSRERLQEVRLREGVRGCYLLLLTVSGTPEDKADEASQLSGHEFLQKGRNLDIRTEIYTSAVRNADLLLEVMAADDVVRTDVVSENGYEKHQVIPLCSMPDGVLSARELDVLNRIFLFSGISARPRYLTTHTGKRVPRNEAGRGNLLLIYEGYSS